MREIKFRAWDKLYMKMATYPCPDIIMTMGGDIYLENKDGQDYKATERFILMQFTGLFDKNGKEIYEGDILKDPGGQYGKVFYSEKSTSYLVNWLLKDGSYETDSCLGYGEVVGNIHENSGLLKEPS